MGEGVFSPLNTEAEKSWPGTGQAAETGKMCGVRKWSVGVLSSVVNGCCHSLEYRITHREKQGGDPLRSLCTAKLFSNFLPGLSHLQCQSQELLITALLVASSARHQGMKLALIYT